MLELRKRLGDATYGIKDLDTAKGIVSGYFAAFGGKDSDGDRIVSGAFTKTINEIGPGSAHPRIKHCLDHRRDQVVGVLQSLVQDTYGLKYESKIGRDTKSRDYLLMCEDGIITEHSIGYGVVKASYNQADEVYELLELKLYEGSGLQFWGANANTPLTGIKVNSLQSPDDLQALFGLLEKAMQTGKYSDDTFLTLIQPRYDAIGVLVAQQKAARKAATEPDSSTQPDQIDFAALVKSTLTI